MIQEMPLDRSAQRHRDPPDRGHARRHDGRPAGRRCLRRRPHRQRAAGAHRGLLGFEAALFMPTGTQSNLCALMATAARRRVHRRPDGPHLPLGRRRRGGAGQHPAAAARPPGRRHAGAGRHRRRHQARRRALRAHPAAGAGEHLGRAGAAAGRMWQAATALARQRGLATHLDGARLFNAAVASGVPGTRHRAALRQRVGVLQQGPGHAGRFGPAPSSTARSSTTRCCT
jgi:hypothetical protein